MSIREVGGQLLNIGDKVKINIDVVGQGDLDGVEITASGKNYWRYILQHPEEVYTVCNLDLDLDCPYQLDGFLEGASWSAEELILLPAPSSRFEVIKNMSLAEMKEHLFPMILSACEDGVPSPELISQWLEEPPEKSPSL